MSGRGDSLPVRRWVVVVVSESDGATRTYGTWRTYERAREFAAKLIERGLDAQVNAIERPTMRAVTDFWGPDDR